MNVFQFLLVAIVGASLFIGIIIAIVSIAEYRKDSEFRADVDNWIKWRRQQLKRATYDKYLHRKKFGHLPRMKVLQRWNGEVFVARWGCARCVRNAK